MHRFTLRRLALLAASAMTVACGSAGASAASTGEGGAPAPAARRDRTVITADDIRATSEVNLYDIVQRLHPEWLTPHTAATAANPSPQPAVYLGSQRAGTVDVLRQFAANAVASLKFYSSSEAQARFGSNNQNGVIQILMVQKP